jgi:hypothetical protein
MRSLSRAGFPDQIATRAKAPLAAAAMKSAASGGRIVVVVIVVGAVFGLEPGRAEAQFGTDTCFGGFGFVLGGFSQVPKPETFLYQRALVDAGRDTRIFSRVVYANNPNSYINHIRDDGSLGGYGVPRTDDRARRGFPRSSTATTRTALKVALPSAVLPLSSFFDEKSRLVWPHDAPTAGNLKEKRTIFELASELVLAETKKNGVASVATVIDARQKLLDYGRPGLQYVRAHETASAPESYHIFLLSLYDSLAQAANPPAAAAAPMPTTPGGLRNR